MKAREKRRRRQARLHRRRLRFLAAWQRAISVVQERTLERVFSEPLFPSLLQKDPA